MSRFFGFAGIAFEDRETANGVGKIERISFWVAAIDRQGFVETGFGQRGTSRLIVHVAEMADRVREPEGIVDLAENRDRFLVVLPRGIGIGAPLELSQIPERSRQLPTVAGFS